MKSSEVSFRDREAAIAALAEVREELGRYEDPRYWKVFWDGTDEEKNAAQKEARRLEYERHNKGVA